MKKKTKINETKSWIKFAEKVEIHKKEIKKIISDFSKKRIIGFGSSARSQTFLNFCGFDHNNIDLIIDNNSLKQNLFSPGTNIKIVDFEAGMSSKPDAIFVLAWNFKDEIIEECKSFGYNGNFIIPFPSSPKVL